jgi:hypothetical protein
MFHAQEKMSNNINVTNGNYYAKHQNNLGVDYFVRNNEIVALEHFRKALAAKSAHEKWILTMSGILPRPSDGKLLNVAEPVLPSMIATPESLSGTSDLHECNGKIAKRRNSLSSNKSYPLCDCNNLLPFLLVRDSNHRIHSILISAAISNQ